MNERLRDAFVHDKEVLGFFTDHLPPDKDPDNILDFGSGAGRMTKFLSKKFRKKNILSIDINNDCIQLLKKSFREKENFKLMTYDINSGKQLNMYFDLIIAFQVYPFLEFPSIVINKLASLLKTDGVLYFFEIDIANLEINIMPELAKRFYSDYLEAFKLFNVHYDFDKFSSKN